MNMNMKINLTYPTTRGSTGVTVDNDAANAERGKQPKTIMTTANTIAKILGQDGSKWATDDGATLDDLLLVYGCVTETETHDDPELAPHRAVFADGSAIVYGDVGWDVEGSRPFLMAGLE